MIYWLLGLVCTVLKTVSANAQTCKYPLPQLDDAHWQKEAIHAKDKGFLWQLEKDGRTSWLLGTLHVNKPETFLLGARVTRALLSSDVLAVELNILDEAVMSQLIKKASSDPVVLTPKTRLAVKTLLLQTCHPSAEQPESITKLFFLPALLQAHMRKSGFFADYGVDLLLLGMAYGMKKPIYSLESAETQAHVLGFLLEGKSIEDATSEYLKSMEEGSFGKPIERMYDAWLRGDIDALQNYAEWCECLDEKNEHTFKIFNDDRNLGFSQGITQLHDKGQRVFAAIGMLHMTGAKAVQVLLEQAGFRVKYLPLE